MQFYPYSVTIKLNLAGVVFKNVIEINFNHLKSSYTQIAYYKRGSSADKTTLIAVTALRNILNGLLNRNLIAA